MRSGKGNREVEEYEEDEFSSRKEGPSSNNTKEGEKNEQKARSKHSVTEQRRRSKINERFQILRDLIPHSDQKRDTASFLLEVIEYVQYLQENVQKYEGSSYQGWSPEPTKLMPWRNSHWRVPSFAGHPQPIKNGSGPGPLDVSSNTTSINPTMVMHAQDPIISDLSRPMDQPPELGDKGMTAPFQIEPAQPLQRPITDTQQEDLVIEGGTISISSVYSQGLLNTLTQSLQNAGVDLSQANISVQIDLGKRANRQNTSETFIAKNHENPMSNQTTACPREASSCENSNQAQKRLRT